MTDLAPPSAGLRRIGNRSKSPIHAQVVVPIGDELTVSDFVADQLVEAGLADDTSAAEESAETKPAGRRGKKS